jgi:hypothetical protein
VTHFCWTESHGVILGCRNRPDSALRDLSALELSAIVAAEADSGPCSLIAEVLAHAVLRCINANPRKPTTQEIGRANDSATREIEDALG